MARSSNNNQRRRRRRPDSGGRRMKKKVCYFCTEKVEVDVKYGLPGMRSAVDDEPITVLQVKLLASQSGSDPNQVAHEFVVGLL